MSSLAAYGAAELTPSAMDLGVAVGKAIGTAAISKGRQAYANRQRGRSVSRSRSRNRTTKAMSDLGHPASKDEARRRVRESSGPVSAALNKTLYQEPLIEIEKNVAGDEALHKRNRDVILHRGSKVCFTIKNRRQTPIKFNIAWVIPKAANTVNPVDFLRGTADERDIAINNSLSFLNMFCLPINSDLYYVVKRKSMVILPDSDKSATPDEGRDFKLLEEYIKTNRKIYFNGSTSTPLQNVHMVWWCDYYNSPTGATSGTADISWRVVDYFKDV